jgi:hypothetical protein
MDQLARMRAIRANMINVGEQVGTSDSSGLAGSTGAITTSAADNISFLQSSLQGGQEISRLRQKAVNTAGDAQLFGAAANLADTFATASGAYDELFKTTP